MMGKRGIRGAEQNQHGGEKGSKLNFHQRCLLRGRGPRNKLYVALFKLLAGCVVCQSNHPAERGERRLLQPGVQVRGQRLVLRRGDRGAQLHHAVDDRAPALGGRRLLRRHREVVTELAPAREDRGGVTIVRRRRGPAGAAASTCRGWGATCRRRGGLSPGRREIRRERLDLVREDLRSPANHAINGVPPLVRGLLSNGHHPHDGAAVVAPHADLRHRELTLLDVSLRRRRRLYGNEDARRAARAFDTGHRPHGDHPHGEAYGSDLSHYTVLALRWISAIECRWYHVGWDSDGPSSSTSMSISTALPSRMLRRAR